MISTSGRAKTISFRGASSRALELAVSVISSPSSAAPAF
jgi:hypothetical protein